MAVGLELKSLPAGQARHNMGRSDGRKYRVGGGEMREGRTGAS